MKSIGDARQQVAKTLAGYNSIMDQTAKDTKDAYKSLGKDITESEKKVGDTKSQTTFRGNDLKSGAITSLKPDATKFNTRAKTVFDKIDGVNKMFDDSVASMKP
jgi:hypothetical protein